MSCFLLYFSRLVAYDFLYEKILRQRKSAVLFDKKTAFRPLSFHDLFSFTIYSLIPAAENFPPPDAVLPLPLRLKPRKLFEPKAA